jgi:hypothetical protein
MKKKKRNAMLFEGIPPIVRAKFKSVCARRGVTMRIYASASFPALPDFEKSDNKSG